MSQVLMATYPHPLRIVDSADGDGTNDYMTKTGGLTGAADSKKGIFSGWVRLDGFDGGQRYVMMSFNGATGPFQVLFDSANNVRVLARSTSAFVLDLKTTGTFTAGATWIHILSSWDLAVGGASHLFITDVSDKTVTTFTNADIDYTVNDWYVFSSSGGGLKMNGCMAEIYFAPGQYLDFSIEPNRRKFISENKKPVHLGATGAMPTGVAPLLYLHLDDGEAVANIATDRSGNGNNMTITGTFDTGSSSPSD